MTSRGRRKYVIKALARSMWAKLPQADKDKCLDGFFDAMLTAVSIDWGIPRHMLLGHTISIVPPTEQEKADRVIRASVMQPPATIHYVGGGI